MQQKDREAKEVEKGYVERFSDQAEKIARLSQEVNQQKLLYKQSCTEIQSEVKKAFHLEKQLEDQYKIIDQLRKENSMLLNEIQHLGQ